MCLSYNLAVLICHSPRTCSTIMVLIVLRLLFFLPLVLCDNETVLCEPGEENDCSKCYTFLAEQVTKHDRNLFEIQDVFFPPNGPPPVFVTVIYTFKDEVDFGDGKNITEIWFWSTSTFYLFQPLHVFQFTSLFFSDTQLQWSEANLTLPLNCENASEAHKQLLTQRVSL